MKQPSGIQIGGIDLRKQAIRRSITGLEMHNKREEIIHITLIHKKLHTLQFLPDHKCQIR